MNNLLSILIPTHGNVSPVMNHVEDDIYTQKGTIEEILLLGPKVPIAPLLSSNKNNEPKICLDLVHLHATRDHVVLMDPSLIQIRPDEELALRASVLETLTHFLGTDGEFFPNRWVYPAGEFIELDTHTPNLASGLNMDIWMPKDTSTKGVAKKWRQLQNEVQMIWHDHPVNEARLERGELSINSIWLHGNGASSDLAQHPILGNVAKILSNHPIGSTLDARIAPLSIDALIPSSQMHHLAFAHILRENEWEVFWQKSIDALHHEHLGQIQLLQYSQGQLYRHTLTSKDLEVGLFTRLFKKNLTKNQQSLAWIEYAKKLHWIPS
jgi:hypothetical protein